MKNRPIHENLDTSFVNLSALVRYLRRRQFVGNVRVELSGYEADIFLTNGNEMRVREHDRIAGRIAEGEEALQRLMIRAREPGGIINVFQTISEAEKNDNSPPVFVETPVQTSQAKPPDFPFELSNKFESKAKQSPISPQDWQMLLTLTGELLSAIDDCLKNANLNFSAAFRKACDEISPDYPFLNPNAGNFAYQNGKITLSEPINAQIFAAGINESLRRIFEKLGAHPKFAETHRAAVQKVLALVHNRRPLYDKFSITPQIEKILGA